MGAHLADETSQGGRVGGQIAIAMTITAMAITISLQADELRRAEDERKAEERCAA